MAKAGRGGGAPSKGNPGGARGGNRGGEPDDAKRSGSGPRNGQQAAGADPGRGKPA